MRRPTKKEVMWSIVGVPLFLMGYAKVAQNGGFGGIHRFLVGSGTTITNAAVDSFGWIAQRFRENMPPVVPSEREPLEAELVRVLRELGPLGEQPGESEPPAPAVSPAAPAAAPPAVVAPPLVEQPAESAPQEPISRKPTPISVSSGGSGPTRFSE